MVNGKQKGKAGEREFVNYLKDRGYSDARRGQQFKGTPDSPDIACPSLSEFHFEVKRRKIFRISYYDQAASDAGENQIPVVAYKENGSRWHSPKWMICLSADDFFDILNKNS